MNITSNTDMNDDVTFYMQGWETEGKPKAIVCLVHGLGEHTGRYEHVGRALNEAGYSLFGFDLRGHGQTGGPRGHFPSLDVILQDDPGHPDGDRHHGGRYCERGGIDPQEKPSRSACLFVWSQLGRAAVSFLRHQTS